MSIKLHRVYYSFDKEEKWLNELAAKGLLFERYTFCTYYFTQGTPGEYLYRIELLENLPSHPKSIEYLQFVQETGAEVLCTYFRWVFFRRRAELGPFDLYSDSASKIAHYWRVISFLGAVGLLNLFIGLCDIVQVLVTGTPTFNHLSVLNLVLGSGLCGLCLRYLHKIRLLKKERMIHE